MAILFPILIQNLNTMSLKNDREDWRFSLFDPKTGPTVPGIEGGFAVDYQVEEAYTEAEDEEEDDEIGLDDDNELDDYTEEEENELVYEEEEDDED